jgi:type II secretory pathway pseudopilin PulG
MMRQASRELLQAARQALESAAKNGQPLPAWLEEIITDAGRQYYARLTGQAENVTDVSFEGDLQNAETAVSANSDAVATLGGANWFLFSSDSDQEGEFRVSQREGLGKNSAGAVPTAQSASLCALESKIEGVVHGQEWRRLEAVRDWGREHGWPSLVLSGEEVIPAGKSAWLEFIWLSRKKEQQCQVYEYITREER